MIRNWLKGAIGTIIFLIVVILFVLMFFDQSNYSKPEIEWCQEHRPLVSMKVCAKEFGY